MKLTWEEQETILRSKLFRGIDPCHLPAILSGLSARREEYAPGAFVLREGDRVTDVGLVLAGHARALKLVEGSEPLIISLLECGSFLGVLLAASRDRRSPVSVQAQEALRVLFLPAENLTSPVGLSEADHSLLLRNFLDSVAEKSLALNDRINCLVRRSVREKVSAYLLRMEAERNSPVFTVPLDRSAMANYLNVERSALSRELSRMKSEGLIDYRKNHFQLLALRGRTALSDDSPVSR